MHHDRTPTAHRLQPTSPHWFPKDLHNWSPATLNDPSAGLDFTTPWQGGSSLRINGSLSADNFIRLYQTDLPAGTGRQIRVACRSSVQPNGFALQIGVRYEGSQFTYSTVTTPFSSWGTTTVDLPATGRPIVEIALAVRLTGAGPRPVDLNVGLLAVLDAGQSGPPAAPTAFTVVRSDIQGNSAEVLLRWTAPTRPPYRYRLSSRSQDGTTLTYLGTTNGTGYYLPSVRRTTSGTRPDARTTLLVQAIGHDLTASKPVETTLNWPA
ncbi:hypothetical protein ACFO1B_02750 [Dactylosporangium siamense]|uniref:Endo-beta-N-acetylglucosaminidase D-like D2 domain-containing protein n=1 Tax=Dactylosporangium siamense TaxID=685454 RepID=A0A919PRV8_9ACTN|nr:hypothetical protein [Dactylosporangium siamense]GIG48587.1 hypothetical protein Dsi01nite_066280 [Dactylosporangium siamense]